MEAGGAGDERGGVGGGQSLVAPSALWGIRGCVLNADALGCSEAVRPSVSFLLGPTLTYPPAKSPSLLVLPTPSATQAGPAESSSTLPSASPPVHIPF